MCEMACAALHRAMPVCAQCRRLQAEGDHSRQYNRAANNERTIYIYFHYTHPTLNIVPWGNFILLALLACSLHWFSHQAIFGPNCNKCGIWIDCCGGDMKICRTTGLNEYESTRHMYAERSDMKISQHWHDGPCTLFTSGDLFGYLHVYCFIIAVKSFVL